MPAATALWRWSLRSARRGLVLGIAIFASGIGMLAASLGLAEESTVLDRYVASPDPNYHYDLISTIPGDGYRGFVLEMTSQQWREAREVDRPIWKHWLTIVAPQDADRHPRDQWGARTTASRQRASIRSLVRRSDNRLGGERAVHGAKPVRQSKKVAARRCCVDDPVQRPTS